MVEGAGLVAVFQCLKEVWGFDALRPLQQDVVQSALANRDAVVVMPTGGGKSLCFQLPPLVDESLTVVVSPLIALMKDQVDGLKVLGVPAAAMNSSASDTETERVRQQLLDGTLRLLYLSPERLVAPGTVSLLKTAKVARFAIDEAHCISAWGHDFRPEFRQLSLIKREFPGVPVQAFTATATQKVQRDIAIQLKLEKPKLFVGTFDRPNLTYRIVGKDDAVQRTSEAVKRYPDEGVIVYCLSRADTERLAAALVARGIPAVAYHAGLDAAVRSKVSEDFAAERSNVIVATVAFGMGIDRANVRCVIHECLPKSMEGYQQETGRAGRDGLPAECVLLYNHGDVVRLKRLISGGPPEVVAHQTNLLEEVRRFVTSHECRHKALSEYFGQAYEVPEDGCGTCDVCLGGTQPLENSTETALRILGTTADLNDSQRSGFGAAFLAQVLTGASTKAVRDRHGDRADGYGAFAGQSADRVTAWIHQLMDLGLLHVTSGSYPCVEISNQGREALRDHAEVQLVENKALVTPAKPKKSRAENTIENVDEGLFERLRAWRRGRAAELGVPAYVVFHDATLMRISAVRPSNSQKLRLSSGVGQKQLTDHGDAILTIVREYCAEMGAKLDGTLEVVRIDPTPVLQPVPDKYADLFSEALSIDDAAAKSGRATSTLAGYLAHWVESAAPASIRPWVDAETESAARAAFAVAGSEHLKPAFEYLDGKVPYETLRVVRAFMRAQLRSG